MEELYRRWQVARRCVDQLPFQMRQILLIGGDLNELREVRQSLLVALRLCIDRLDLGGREQRHANQRSVAQHRTGNDPRAEKDSGQRVIVFGRNRIELVIVTAGTRQRQSEKRSPHNVDFVVHVIGDHLLLIDIAGNEISDCQHPGRDERFRIDLGRGRRLHQVSGQLPCDEVVVPQITIERGDHPIAIPPRFTEVALDRQLNQIARVGIADNVQPVPTPPLAITGRGQ